MYMGTGAGAPAYSASSQPSTSPTTTLSAERITPFVPGARSSASMMAGPHHHQQQQHLHAGGLGAGAGAGGPLPSPNAGMFIPAQQHGYAALSPQAVHRRPFVPSLQPGMLGGMGMPMPMSISPSALSPGVPLSPGIALSPGAGAIPGMGPPTPLGGMPFFQQAGAGAGGPSSGASTPSFAPAIPVPGRSGGISPIPGPASAPGAGTNPMTNANGGPAAAAAAAAAAGIGKPGMIGGRPLGRKQRGLPQHTPFKTTGHNSKPSVSMNGPALFQLLSSVQGATPKKRNVVSLPKEVDEAAQQEAAEKLAALADDEDEDGGLSEADKAAQTKSRRVARDTASVRAKWPIRVPEALDAQQLSRDEQQLVLLPEQNIVSAAIYPEAWPYENGLPESIDIYLPGKGAWDIYREQRAREQQLEAAEERRGSTSQNELDDFTPSNLDSRSVSQSGARGDLRSVFDAPREPSWGYNDEATFGVSAPQLPGDDPEAHARNISISSPADHNMVSFKLNRYLQSQADAEAPPTSGELRRSSATYSDNAVSLPQYDQTGDAPTQVGFTPAHASSASFAAVPTHRFGGGPPPILRSTSDRGNGAMGFDGLGRPEYLQRGQSHNGTGVYDKNDRINSGAHAHAGIADISASLEPDDSATAGLASTGADLLEGLPSADTTASSILATGGNKSASTPNWKDLARGFGYDIAEVDEEAASTADLQSGPHSRRASKSRHSSGAQRRREDADEDGTEDDEGADLRTNPSEDADDSDVSGEDEDEEADEDDEGQQHRRKRSQASERHWARRSTAQLSDFGVRPSGTASGHARATPRGSNDMSGVSLSELEHRVRDDGERRNYLDGTDQDEDDISEATTEGASEEVYSNPSDEEAAQIRREERRERRARRRASRGLEADELGLSGSRGGAIAAGRRPRSGTVNTLPSSSFGEGDDYDQRRNRADMPRARPPGFRAGASRNEAYDDIVSNPSDEDQYSGGAETFGGRGPLDHPAAVGHIGRMSEDFKFPQGGYTPGRNQPISEFQTQAYHESSGPLDHTPRFGGGDTIGRSAGHTMLNPAAKEFSFGGSSGGGGSGSGFGAFSAAAGRMSLNAAAPTFTPRPFTFTAPGVAKVTIPDPVQPAHVLRAQQEAAAGPISSRDAQGREKRPRFGRQLEGEHEGEFSFQHSEDAFDPTLHGVALERPSNSTASLEGPLRNPHDGTAVRPFGSSGSVHEPIASQNHARQRSSVDYSSLQPTAAPFQPTWSRSTAFGPAPRPGIPNFGGAGHAADRPAALIYGNSGVLAHVPASDFTFTVGNKAIPIRRPDEAGDVSAGTHSQAASINADARDQPRSSIPDVPRDMDSEHDQENERRNSVRPSQGSHAGDPSRMPLSSMFDQYSDDTKAAASALVSASAVAAAKSKLGRSAPMPIPMLRPDQAAQPHQGHGNNSGLSRSFRSHGRNGTAESLAISLSSAGRALRNRRAGTVGVEEEDDDISLSDVEDEDEDRSDDEDAVSDIIEELGERIEKALDGWAGKILDEVTIMGQVRPSIGAKLDAAERDVLLESFGVRIEEQLQEHFARFKEATAAQTAAAAAAVAAAAKAGNESTNEAAVPASGHPVRTGSGHPPLDAQGELDFDYVSDTLDQKIADLKRELMAAFDTALPKAMESVVDKIPAPVSIPTSAPSAASAPAAATLSSFPSTMDLSLNSSQELADLLLRRLQTVLDANNKSPSDSLESTLEKVLEPLLEDGFARAQVKSVVDRTEATHQLTELIVSKFGELEHVMGESRSSIGDQLQVALINGLVPHIETLRQEPVHPDLVAARVVEILAPMLEGNRERDREAMSRKSSEDGRSLQLAGPTAHQREDIADTTVERLLPFLNALKPAHIDVQEIGAMMESALSKQHISAEADLEPVIALLEPLVSRQEESRGLSRQTIDRLKEVESTLAVLPGAINAKTEIFLTATQQTQDAQGSILERVNEVASQLQSTLHRTAELDEQRDELIRQLDEARKEVNERKAEADEAKAELSAANGYGSTLKDELTRLEARLDQAEKASEEVTEQMEELRTRAQQAREREHTAERRADQMTAQAREAQNAADAAQAQNLLLQKRLEELSSELAEARAERNRQREGAAQATADAIARAERAEMAAEEARQRADARVDDAARVERKAHEQVSAVAERAAKAEGELVGMEKRVVEQDAKIATLQQVTATQKQKAAQSQQKLAESDKKMMHFEQQAQDLAIANARLAEMEARLADKDAVEERLANSQDAEMRLREELSTYHSRFLDLEKDLITMKDGMVGRDELEGVQAELAASREEVARLNGQLAEREQQAAAALAAVKEQQQGNVNTWNSMHAPGARTRDMPTPTAGSRPMYSSNANGGGGWADSDSSTDSFAPTGQSAYSSYAHIAPLRTGSVSGASDVFGPSVRVVPVKRDEGGWWS